MSTKISVRLSDSVLQAVDEAAKREGRNRSQQIEWVLRSSLAGKEIEDWSKNTIAEAAGHVATEAEAIAKWGPKEPQSKFRTSPDGKPCKHFMLRCDKGCWK